MAQDDTQAELLFECMYVCSLAWSCLAKGYCAVVCRRQSSDAGRQSHRVGMGLIPKEINGPIAVSSASRATKIKA